MAAEDWIEGHEYEPEEGEDIFDVRCKYCGRSGFRWHSELGDRWVLRHENGERHKCPEYEAARMRPATADEFHNLWAREKFVHKGTVNHWSGQSVQLQNLPRGLTGNRADFMILDDPHAEMPIHQRLLEKWYTDSKLSYKGIPLFWDKTGDPNMPTTAPKKTKKDYNTIGVRYHGGGGTVYTFKVRKGVKLYLGQELIDMNNGNYSVYFVVRLDAIPQDTNAAVTYRYLSHKVAPL